MNSPQFWSYDDCFNMAALLAHERLGN